MKTLVIGASTNPARYANLATLRLLKAGHEIELIGIKAGEIAGHTINTQKLPFENIDTVTLYIGEAHQPEYYDYIIGLKPRRVIFNPGAENPAFEAILAQKDIEPIEACTLVMLSIGNY